jgi:LmbE family N-acetylglucosaminyl deacetylase
MPDRQPVSLSPTTVIIELTPHEIDAKIAAFKLHTSQAPLFGFFEETMRRRGKTEVFHLANTIKPRKLEMETDLFAGIEE